MAPSTQPGTDGALSAEAGAASRRIFIEVTPAASTTAATGPQLSVRIHATRKGLTPVSGYLGPGAVLVVLV